MLKNNKSIIYKKNLLDVIFISKSFNKISPKSIKKNQFTYNFFSMFDLKYFLITDKYKKYIFSCY